MPPDSRPAALLRAAGLMAGVAAVYFAAGKLGLSLAFLHASASPVWPPTGIALAAFLLFGRRVWPGVFAGAFLANITNLGTVATSIGIATGNTLEGLVGAWLVTRFASGSRAFERTPDLFRYAVLAGFVATALSATFGVTTLTLAGFADPGAYGAIWFTWWLGDAGGALVVAPPLILWGAALRDGVAPGLRGPKARHAAAVGVLLVGSAAALFGAFPQPGWNLVFLFTLLPAVLWFALRRGPRATATALLFLDAIAVLGTLRGTGPFARPSENEALLLLQLFLISASVTTLAIAAAARAVGGAAPSAPATGPGGPPGARRAWLTPPRRAALLAGTTLVPLLAGTLVFYALTRGVVGVQEEARWLALAVGGVLSAMLAALVYLLASSEARARALAAEMTAELRAREAALARRTAELERSNADLQRFASVASHDLQEPLRAISSYSQLVQQRYGDRLDAEAREFLGFAAQGAQRLQTLVEDLLTYTRVGTSEPPPPQAVDLGAAVDRALEDLEGVVRTKRAQVTREPLPPVRADPGQVAQLVQHLLSNALKFHGAKPPQVHVRGAREGGMVKVEVRDEGLGIDPAYAERIFVPFKRLHGPGIAGTGVGLAICKRIVERHGGRIWVESDGEGRGASFLFTLPAAEEAGGPALSPGERALA